MDRCPACPAKYKCIPPSGPSGAEILCIGDAPGFDDERHNTVFAGRLGQEFDNHFLPIGGLRRDNVRVTNAIRCLPDREEGKISMTEPADVELARVCSEHFLHEELTKSPATLIIPMGGFANYALTQEVVNLDLHHGMPWSNDLWEVFPMYAQTQGLSDTKKLFMIRQDWIRLKRFRNGTLKTWTDEFPNPEYFEVTDEQEINDIDPTQWIAGDTEFTPDAEPHCLTYSVQSGTARLIRAERTDLLAAFNRKMQEWESIIIFQNWMADKPICIKMGVYMPDRLIRDTMVRMNTIGGMLKGLKPFGFRELGVMMEDFEDVVMPHSLPRILEYYRYAASFDWPKPAEELQQNKEGIWKIKKPQGMNTKFKRFFTDYSKNPNKDIIKSWDNWKAEHENIEALCGRFTGLDVRDLPFDVLLRYACRDADITLRAWPILEEMMWNMPGKPPENWRR